MKVTLPKVLATVGVLLAGAILLIGVALQFGPFELDWSEVFRDQERNLHREVATDRLMRAILALSVGSILAVVGTLYQALTRNPLADPFLLGVSGGAAVGATLAISLGVTSIAIAGFIFPTPALFAFIGAIASLAFVIKVARVNGRLSIYRLLLTGVIVNFLASAIVVALKTFGDHVEVRSLLLWLVGTLSWASSGEAILCMLAALLGGLYSMRWIQALNVLAIGDAGTRMLGVDVGKTQRHIFWLSSLMVGLAVSVSGLIGFVGLVVPHAMRQIVGPDHRILLPVSWLAGGLFLLTCDLISRILFPVLGSDAPVGVVTACIGGPLFLWLLVKDGKGGQPHV